MRFRWKFWEPAPEKTLVKIITTESKWYEKVDKPETFHTRGTHTWYLWECEGKRFYTHKSIFSGPTSVSYGFKESYDTDSEFPMTQQLHALRTQVDIWVNGGPLPETSDIWTFRPALPEEPVDNDESSYTTEDNILTVDFEKEKS